MLDGFDLRILDALQRDGRLTNADLAEVTGLSASQCSRRRMALEQDGTIAAYVALLDRETLELGMTVFVEVTLHAHSGERARSFARLVNNMPEVQEAFSLTGNVDYLLKIVVTDLPALSRILNDVLLAHDSVARIHSSIVLDQLKQTTRLPLNHLR